MKRAYKVVDVFTKKPLLGNPLAVILDANGLEDSEMQAIARWTNLSETTFLLPPTNPEADYRLRIFTPGSELPFAGHPTIGTAHAILEAGRVQARGGRLIQECGVGLVGITVEGQGPGQRLMLELPQAKVSPLQPDDIDELEAILGHTVVREAAPAIIDVGAVWVVAQLRDAATVLGLKPDFARSLVFERRLGVTGLSVFGRHETGDAEIEVRTFAPSCGVNEDPVCGSCNGSIAVFQRDRGLLPAPVSYTAAQGQCIGRSGRVAVNIDADGQVRLGGAAVTCVDGTLIY